MLPSIKHIYIYKVLFFESAYVFLTSYPALLYWFTYIGSYFFIYICNKFSSPMNFKLFLHMYFVVWKKYICNISLFFKNINIFIYSTRDKYNQGYTRGSHRKRLCLPIWIFRICKESDISLLEENAEGIQELELLDYIYKENIELISS